MDVGSGGGSPGIPLASALPDRQVVLLEANARKVVLLERVAAEFPNVRVVRGRAEEQEVDTYGAAVARLAPPPVAAEWCLALVQAGGGVVLFTPGRPPTLQRGRRGSEPLGGGEPEEVAGAIVIPKIGPTPPGFPRRPAARKRPLA